MEVDVHLLLAVSLIGSVPFVAVAAKRLWGSFWPERQKQVVVLTPHFWTPTVAFIISIFWLFLTMISPGFMQNRGNAVDALLAVLLNPLSVWFYLYLGLHGMYWRYERRHALRISRDEDLLTYFAAGRPPTQYRVSALASVEYHAHWASRLPAGHWVLTFDDGRRLSITHLLCPEYLLLELVGVPLAQCTFKRHWLLWLLLHRPTA